MSATVADVLRNDARWSVSVGDCLDGLRAMPDGCAQTCVTSPPYYGLRDYGHAGQIGMEPTPQEFVARLVAVFAEVRRVLRDDGTLWVNIGDSYAAAASGKTSGNRRAKSTIHSVNANVRAARSQAKDKSKLGVREKNLLGIPWHLAFALQDDGWFLRSDIVWAKPNPMPESVTDRPTRAHEYVFLLTKRARYFYDAGAIKETATNRAPGNVTHKHTTAMVNSRSAGLLDIGAMETRNARSVWTITPEPYEGAHFATMPPDLARRCILAGSRKGDVVLDPFGGAATTALVALAHQRRALLCELNADYVPLMRERLAAVDTDAAEPLRMAAGADFGPLFGGSL